MMEPFNLPENWETNPPSTELQLGYHYDHSFLEMPTNWLSSESGIGASWESFPKDASGSWQQQDVQLSDSGNWSAVDHFSPQENPTHFSGIRSGQDPAVNHLQQFDYDCGVASESSSISNVLDKEIDPEETRAYYEDQNLLTNRGMYPHDYGSFAKEVYQLQVDDAFVSSAEELDQLRSDDVDEVKKAVAIAVPQEEGSLHWMNVNAVHDLDDDPENSEHFKFQFGDPEGKVDILKYEEVDDWIKNSSSKGFYCKIIRNVQFAGIPSWW